MTAKDWADEVASEHHLHFRIVDRDGKDVPGYGTKITQGSYADMATTLRTAEARGFKAGIEEAAKVVERNVRYAGDVIAEQIRSMLTRKGGGR